MGMAMAILEGGLPADKASKLEAIFAEGTQVLEPGIAQMFLVRNDGK